MKKALALVLFSFLSLSLGACASNKKVGDLSPPLQKEINQIIAEEEAKKEKLIAQAKINEMIEKGLIETNKDYLIEILGLNKKDPNRFGVQIFLQKEPALLESGWWTPKIKSVKDFENGILVSKMRINEKAFLYLIEADMQEIGLDQFVLVIKYIHPISGISYTHSVLVHRKGTLAEIMKEN